MENTRVGSDKENSIMEMHRNKLTSNFGLITSTQDCLCTRPRENIICTNCGFKGFARIEHVCPKHPETIFLFDWARCPNCKGSLLRECR